jgi:hypothetical protein
VSIGDIVTVKFDQGHTLAFPFTPPAPPAPAVATASLRSRAIAPARPAIVPSLSASMIFSSMPLLGLGMAPTNESSRTTLFDAWWKLATHPFSSLHRFGKSLTCGDFVI